MHPFPLGILVEHLDGDVLVADFDDLADLDVVDAAEEGALALRLALAEIERIHCARQAVGAVGQLERLLRDPGVLEAFVDGDAFGDVDREHAVDEVESRVADRVPVRRRVVEAAGFDLFGEVVGVVAGAQFVGERGEATQADVEDDAEGPNVHGVGVFAVARVFEDFGCDIF